MHAITSRISLCAGATLLLLLAVLAEASAAAGESSIARLKDLHLETVLVAKAAGETRIVAPDDDATQDCARRVQQALRAATGVEFPIVRPAAVTEADARKVTLILLGNFQSNQAIRELYDRHYCFTDGFYPGKDGFEVRTIHNPLNRGRNCVLLGGSDAHGVRAATDAFVDVIKSKGIVTTEDDGRTVKLARVLATKSNFHPAKPAEAWARERSDHMRRGLDRGLVRSTMGGRGSAIEAGFCYYLSGDEAWGKIFRETALHYCELAKPKNDWALLDLSNDEGGQYFWPWKFAMIWDAIEEGPVFSDDDRLKITEMLLRLTQWVSNRDHFYLDRQKGALYAAPNELRQGHPTYAALSMFFGAEYFRYYYPQIMDFQPRYADVARIFDGQAQSYKSSDNATVYSPLATGQYFSYLLTRQALTPRIAENLRAFADSVVITTDNRADACTFGDTPTFVIGHARGLGFLARAAWYFNDPGLRWAFDWIAPRTAGAGNEFPYGDTWYQGLYYTEGERTAPTRLLGVAPVKVDRGLYDYILKKDQPATGVRAPALESCFDKLSLRRNFSPRDEYLLLSGLSGVLYHGHDDGNSVLRLTWNDRVWLANMGYRAVAATEHNGLMVRRDGQYSAPPAFTSLDARGDFPGSSFTRTTSAGYNGTNWSRNIFWRKGGYFLFFDEVEAKQPGHYQLDLLWRTLGEATLSGDSLRVTQDGERFNIKNGDRSRKALSLKKPDKNSNWNHYGHADGTVRILAEMSEAKGGETQVYSNLLFPGDPDAIVLERLGPRTARLRHKDGLNELVGVARAGNEIGPYALHAAAYAMNRDRLTVFDATEVAVAGLKIRSAAPVSFDLEWKTRTGIFTCAQATEVAMQATGVTVDGQRSGVAAEERTIRVKIPAGTHTFTLEGAGLTSLEAIVNAVAEEKTAPPVTGLGSEFLVQSWRSKVQGPLKTLRVGDLDGAGRPSIVTASANTIRAFAADGKERWSFRTSAPVGCLHLQDLNHDGKAEVIFGAGPTVYVLSPDGREKWNYEVTHKSSPLSAITTADLEGDGQIAVIAGNELSTVSALDADGHLRWQSFKDIGLNGVTVILADDLDGDGKTEMVIGTSRGHGTVMLTHDGQQVKWRFPGTHTVARSAAPSAKGEKRVVIGGPLGFGPLRFVEAATGRTRNLLKVPDDLVDLMPVELRGNHEVEFVSIFAATGLHVFDADGHLRRHAMLPGFASALAVADFNHDQQPDIAVGAQDGRIWILDADGTIKAEANVGEPVVALGIVNDGETTRLVVGANDGTLVVFKDDRMVQP